MLEGRLKQAVERETRETILRGLVKCGWHRAKAAAWLGVSLPTLRVYMRQFNLRPPRKEKSP
jgi:transcriptional regulator with GAF, ATPase, and Fis domain